MAKTNNTSDQTQSMKNEVLPTQFVKTEETKPLDLIEALEMLSKSLSGMLDAYKRYSSAKDIISKVKILKEFKVFRRAANEKKTDLMEELPEDYCEFLRNMDWENNKFSLHFLMFIDFSVEDNLNFSEELLFTIENAIKTIQDVIEAYKAQDEEKIKESEEEIFFFQPDESISYDEILAAKYLAAFSKTLYEMLFAYNDYHGAKREPTNEKKAVAMEAKEVFAMYRDIANTQVAYFPVEILSAIEKLHTFIDNKKEESLEFSDELLLEIVNFAEQYKNQNEQEKIEEWERLLVDGISFESDEIRAEKYLVALSNSLSEMLKLYERYQSSEAMTDKVELIQIFKIHQRAASIKQKNFSEKLPADYNNFTQVMEQVNQNFIAILLMFIDSSLEKGVFDFNKTQLSMIEDFVKTTKENLGTEDQESENIQTNDLKDTSHEDKEKPSIPENIKENNANDEQKEPAERTVLEESPLLLFQHNEVMPYDEILAEKYLADFSKTLYEMLFAYSDYHDAKKELTDGKKAMEAKETFERYRDIANTQVANFPAEVSGALIKTDKNFHEKLQAFIDNKKEESLEFSDGLLLEIVNFAEQYKNQNEQEKIEERSKIAEQNLKNISQENEEKTTAALQYKSMKSSLSESKKVTFFYWYMDDMGKKQFISEDELNNAPKPPALSLPPLSPRPLSKLQNY